MVLDRALEIADLQVNRADVSLLGQTLWRSNSIEARSVAHAAVANLASPCGARRRSPVREDASRFSVGYAQ